MVYDFIPLKQGLKLVEIGVIECDERVYDFIPLKQGLKHYYILLMLLLLWSIQVYDFIPLKQGLKLIDINISHKNSNSLWLYSIKTRIETILCIWVFSWFCKVYDFIPLKQGLKHRTLASSWRHETVYDFIPLKQGLKLKFFWAFVFTYIMFMTLFH